MTYDVGVRQEIRGELVCESALHVGGWDPSVEADLAVARDGLGHPVIPGTSLAGALRAWSGHHRDEATINFLFGHLTHRGQDGSAARIRIDDAALIVSSASSTPIQPVIRDGVGIDRRTGSAAAGFLYSREVLPPGTRFAFRMVADEPRTADPVISHRPPVAEAVDDLLGALRDGLIPLGARRTTGLGRVRLENITRRRANLSEPAGLLGWLTGTTPHDEITAALPHPRTTGALTIQIGWSPDGALLVKDSLEGAVVDALPLTARDPVGRVRLLLPGSSIKGVLRSHAERIVRTLLDQDAGPLGDVLDREKLPGVVGLFGRSPERSGDAGWRGALEVTDCHSCGHLAAADWDAVLDACPTGSPLPAAGPSPENNPAPSASNRRQETNDQRDKARNDLNDHLAHLRKIAPDLPDLRISDHVAIDRWTGGASTGQLFSVLEPMGAAWQPIILRVDTGRAGGPNTTTDDTGEIDDANQQVAAALLLLVLRDLADGWLTFESGRTRGRGQISVQEIRFSGAGLRRPWSALAGRTLGEVLTDPPAAVTTALTYWASAVAPDSSTPTPIPTPTREAAR